MLRALVFLLLAAPAWGADPPRLKEHSPVPKKETNLADLIPVEAGKYRFFGVTTDDGKPYAGPVTWVTDGTSVGIKEVEKAMTLFGVISGFEEPGEYDVPAGDVIVWGKVLKPGESGITSVQAWGVVDGKAKMLLALKFLVGPAPPKPDPTPDPVVGKMSAFIVIEPSGVILPNRAALIKAADEWQNANQMGRRWVYDNVIDQTGKPPADLVTWLNRAKGKSLPHLYCITAEGGILFEGPLDTSSPDNLKAQLSKYNKGK